MLPKKTKFAIIGAGPAGLSTALALKEQGYQDITVFEKESKVGGKCLSYHYNGQNFDLGANLTTPRYDAVRALGEELGLTFRLPPERRIVNVGTEEYEDLTQANFLKKLAIRAGAQFYIFIRDLTKIDQPGYSNLKSGLERPFREWLDNHGLGMFQEMFEVLFVAYGYGHVMDLSAAYALKFFDKHHINAAVNVILGKDVPTTMDFKEGFQELWKRVIDKYGIKVYLNSKIKSAKRCSSGVDISFEYSNEYIQATCLEKFDKIILACPLQDAKFLDLSLKEQDLFSKISTYEYYTSVSVIDNLPSISTYVYPYARKLTPGYPTVFYPPNGGNVFLSYAYGGPGITEDIVKARLKATVENPLIGGKLVETLHIQKWNYFPHITSEDMLAGFYDQLEELQGTNNTLYVGEVLSFTLVELILDYCRNLVKKHVAAS